MAVIYYRFRSQKPDHVSTIKFDGTGLTVFELKREIIMVNDLIHSTDIDIVLYSTENIQAISSTGEDGDKELTDDNEVVSRSSAVLVRRTMCPKKGRGNVQRYVDGKPRIQTGSTISKTNNTALGSAILGSGAAVEGSEEDMLNKVFNQQDEQWLETQDVMATARKIDNYRPGQNDPVPDYYICYKCGEKGKHNIKNCPKNNDPNWDGVRVRKTTGIPKSQLKAIAKPDEMDMENLPNGTATYMVNEDGNYVVAVADTKAWEQFQNIKKGEVDRNNGDIEVEDGELKDTETGMLWKNPVRTPCCSKIYSRKYIEDALIESDFSCPNCHKDQIFIDDLVPDEELQKKVDEYIKNLADNQGGNSAKRHQPGAVGIPPNGANMLPMPPMMPNMGAMPMMPMMPMQQMNMPFMPFMPMNNQTPQNDNKPQN